MTEQSTQLQHWIDRLRNGNPIARDELLRHLQYRLRILAHQMLARYPGVQQWETTSDVSNAALFRLANALDDSNVRTWLRTPVDVLRLGAIQIRRELIDLARTFSGPRGMGSHLLPPGCRLRALDGATSPSHDPCNVAAWLEFHRRIEQELTADECEIVDLLYYQGLSKQEAADTLAVSLSTVKRRWQLARIKLMNALGDDWPIE